MLRRCLLAPIPEFDSVAGSLSVAADSLLAGNLADCERHLKDADLQAPRNFSYKVCGPISFEIHRQTCYPKYPKVVGSARERMPNKSIERQVFKRDGYRCRFCSSRVILRQARDVFRAALPTAARWGRTNDEKHFGLATLTASLDHLLPFGRGGSNDIENLVTACGPCQFGRVHWTLEEVELEDPISYAPVVDEWDGLQRLGSVRASPIVCQEA